MRQQLNTILETRETARGLIVNINDVLFDFNKYTLKPGAREKLAKVAGILLAYPGLKVQLEGHTDSVGSDEYNQKLSEQRADAVRDYLTAQGVAQTGLSAVGFGKADPVASNDTAAGRQQNRRVDMVVSGEPIGVGRIPARGSVGRFGIQRSRRTRFRRRPRCALRHPTVLKGSNRPAIELYCPRSSLSSASAM